MKKRLHLAISRLFHDRREIQVAVKLNVFHVNTYLYFVDTDMKFRTALNSFTFM